jgi:heme-degrading monooxygenase HmoA
MRVLLLTILTLLAACAMAPSTMSDHAKLVHDVYFTLEDASAEACQQLVDECYARLAGIDGIVYFAAGIRDPELLRYVNDRGYDVSLHVFFRDRAAHDAYQTASAHEQFIAANRENWRQVRVFDSAIGGH